MLLYIGWGRLLKEAAGEDLLKKAEQLRRELDHGLLAYILSNIREQRWIIFQNLNFKSGSYLIFKKTNEYGS